MIAKGRDWKVHFSSRAHRKKPHKHPQKGLGLMERLIINLTFKPRYLNGMWFILNLLGGAYYKPQVTKQPLSILHHLVWNCWHLKKKKKTKTRDPFVSSTISKQTKPHCMEASALAHPPSPDKENAVVRNWAAGRWQQSMVECRSLHLWLISTPSVPFIYRVWCAHYITRFVKNTYNIYISK